MTDTHILYETHGAVARITLNRPKAMNSLNVQTRQELGAAQAKAEADDAIRIIIITGSGRAFSSGTDLVEVTQTVGVPMDNSISEYKPLIDAITKSDKIYIAAINGVAAGVSLGLALGADMAIMSSSATIFSPFSNIGLVPDGGASWLFLQHLGYKRAFAAIARCSHLDAQTCLDIGMVNHVVAPEDLEASAMELAQDLAARAPLSLRYTKRILRASATMSMEDSARLESEYQNKCIRSEDSTNAIKAFVSKTKPVFKGR